MPTRPTRSRQAARNAPRKRRAAAGTGAPPAADASAHTEANYDDTGDDEQPGVLPFLTVAIGASAGGLHAFTTFLANLPPDTDMAFVLIQHLDPIHKSLLVGLLAPHTAMQVVEAADGMVLAPNTVFVIPPDATMTVESGHLVVVSPAPARANRWPIDAFFASLADDQKHHAVCIVLSGAGSDGARSLREVKHQGGLVLAQSLDDGQMMTGMPYSAATTGMVDHVLPVTAMPATLLDHQRSLRRAAPVGQDAVTDEFGGSTARSFAVHRDLRIAARTNGL